jgi:hypothetical protein
VIDWSIYTMSGLLSPPRIMNRGMAELLYSWDSPRWPRPHDPVQYCEFHHSRSWLDLCWWNGAAWQYVTTRAFTNET